MGNRENRRIKMEWYDHMDWIVFFFWLFSCSHILICYTCYSLITLNHKIQRSMEVILRRIVWAVFNYPSTLSISNVLVIQGSYLELIVIAVRLSSHCEQVQILIVLSLNIYTKEPLSSNRHSLSMLQLFYHLLVWVILLWHSDTHRITKTSQSSFFVYLNSYPLTADSFPLLRDIQILWRQFLSPQEPLTSHQYTLQLSFHYPSSLERLFAFFSCILIWIFLRPLMPHLLRSLNSHPKHNSPKNHSNSFENHS